MGRGGKKQDFYIIYAADTGSTFATALTSQLKSLVPEKAKLELDMEEPEKRGPRAQASPSETEEQSEVKRVLGASWLIILVTPGVFECPLCIREAALGLVHWKPTVMVQHLRSCPFIWRELERAPAPLRRAIETATSQRTQPVCPFLPEYADLAALYLMNLHPRLRPFTPEMKVDVPPGPEAIDVAEFQKALLLVQGRVGLVYNTAAEDIAHALRHNLTRSNKRIKVYEIRVNEVGDLEEELSKEPPFRKIPNGHLPRLSLSRGLMRTWSETFIPKLSNDPTEKLPPPSIEGDVSILFLIVSQGVLASPKALEAIEASWTKTSMAKLVLVQDMRSVHSMSTEMIACRVPRHIRSRLLASFCIPFVFKFGALAVVERMVRLQVLPGKKQGSEISSGPDVFLLHTLEAESDWAHVLRQEMQRQAPAVGCILDADADRDCEFLKHLASNAKVIGMLASTGFLSHSWGVQILNALRPKDAHRHSLTQPSRTLIVIQPLHLAFDLEAEVELAAEKLVGNVDITRELSVSASQDARRKKRGQLNIALKRMPMLALEMPGSDVAAALAQLATGFSSSIDMVACGVPATLRFLDATQDIELVQRGLCALANLGFYGGDENAELAVKYNAGAQIAKSLADCWENVRVAIQGLRAIVNLGLSNSGPEFLQQVFKEGCVQVIDEIADKHASKSSDVRKQLCALHFAFTRYPDTRKFLEKSTWTDLVQGWVAELKSDDDKLAQLQAAVNLREALATAFEKAPPKGYSSAVEAPGVLRNLTTAFNVFRPFAEEADPNLYRKAASTCVPCMKFCSWQGLLKDHDSHDCARKNAKVVPTESPSLQEAIDTTKRVERVRVSTIEFSSTTDHRPIIWIRPGTYTGGISIDKPVRLMNDGPSAECIIEAKDKSAVTFVSGCQGAQLHGLTLRCVGGKKAAVVSAFSGTPGVHSCHIHCETPQGSGVYVQGDSSEGRFWPQFVQNVIHGCPGYGFFFGGEARASVEDNDISSNTLGGVHVADLAAPTLSNNRICDNPGYGVMVDRGDVEKKSNACAIVESNTIARNGAEGVGIGRNSQCDIRKNLIEGNVGQGMLVKGKVNIEGNVVMRNKKGGIELLDSAHAEIYKNRINMNEGYGISVKAGAAGEISSNQVMENSKEQISRPSDPKVNPDLEVAEDNITDETQMNNAGTMSMTASNLFLPPKAGESDEEDPSPRPDRRGALDRSGGFG